MANMTRITRFSKASNIPAVINRQSGVILIVALVMLLVMTSLGITTMSGATLQERMAGNSRQQTVARLNAGAALKAAESYLDALGAGGLGKLTFDEIEPQLSANIVGFYSARSTVGGVIAKPVSDVIDDFTDDALWPANSFDATNIGGIGTDISLTGINLGARAPRFIIEYLGCIEHCIEPTTDEYYAFRIIAIGWGQSGNASAVLQAMYLSKQ